MEIKAITFDFINKKLIITYENDTESVYLNRQSYITAHPSRSADCDAIGWV